MKKQILLFVLALLPLVASADASGTCGNNLTWTYVESTGTLTISGTGAMKNYSYDSPKAPWSSYSIIKVILEDGITSIGECAFNGCSSLTSVTIPNSVTSIGGSAFSGCSGLTSVTIPNSVTSINESAFNGCSGLTSITVEQRNTVYDSRNNCNAIIETSSNKLITGCYNTVIPISVTNIGEYAFCGCSSLTSIIIPINVTRIGRFAFMGCNNLRSVHISDLVAWCNILLGCNPLSYAHHLFLNGEEIKDLVIPNSVTSIGGLTFRDCSGLSTVTIPNSVTSIGHDAFGGCNNLLTVNSEILEPFNCHNAFSTNTQKNGTLFVPIGTKDLYTQCDGWREFQNIVEVEESFVWLSIKSTQGVTKIKVIKGTKQEIVITAEDGWKLLSVTMNGTDVTGQVKDGASFTTPAINSDATIIIVYEQETPSDARAATRSQADIKVVSDGVVISNAAPDTRCIIYGSDGQQVVNTVINDGTRKIALQQGQVYILTINGRTLKFAL